MQNDRITSEVFLNRVEGYTANLPQAVRSPNSAQFGMLLSLIASSHERYSSDASATAGADGGFQLPSKPVYPEPDSLFNRDLVGRLNHSVTAQEPGEFAYLVSHLNVKTLMPLNSPIRNDRFAQISLASLGGHMLEQISAAREGFQAVA
ncbi:hypothetical protein [Nitrincola sp.]|uniref:hypothetical protein n=1 Tax=Nitrincola sp. TaxID=1926584 RepID=UPI003A902993